MTMHRAHPDPRYNDSPDAVLFDNCERCAQHSETFAWSLDNGTFARVWERRTAEDRTAVERKVIAQIERAVDIVSRLERADHRVVVAVLDGRTPPREGLMGSDLLRRRPGTVAIEDDE